MGHVTDEELRSLADAVRKSQGESSLLTRALEELQERRFGEELAEVFKHAEDAEDAEDAAEPGECGLDVLRRASTWATENDIVLPVGG